MRRFSALCAFAAIPCSLAVIAAPAGPSAQSDAGGDTCLVVAAENIAKGAGNFFVYLEFSDKQHKFEAGDALEYDILLPALNPVLKGGIDADLKNENLPAATNGRPWVRDSGLKDQNAILQHGDGLLEPAKDKWYHRVIDLSKLAGATTTRWNIVFEGDPAGQYVQLLDNIRITRGGKTVLSLYENGAAPAIKPRQSEGYSKTVLIDTVSRADVEAYVATSGRTAERAGAASKIDQILDRARKTNQMRTTRDEFHAELDIARQIANHLGDAKLAAEIHEAAKAEDLAAFDDGNFEKYFESLHQARHRLSHAHPQMQKFTGHLVGHAHIDLQWLWTWDETLKDIIPQTFGQAVKFMREFPDFTFSQSSPCLYVATEEHHPELFKDMQEMVKSGQWEIVGGRWCEGDNNMISPESHVRQLLYGQRYFQAKFGKMCDVGWEPDTFGHCWTLPQVLKKAGIDYYYFCRGADHAASPAKDTPLFWWEGPDGSRVLAFQEPATGGWYNDVVTDEKVKELAKFVTKVGSLDHLMVYGVGNHGGGPTREYIEAALEMRKRGLWPTIKFSTASAFFRRLSEMAGDLKIPTIKDELNPIFEGCYTSHSRIKKYNRDCESLLETAEVFAALAASTGDKGQVKGDKESAAARAGFQPPPATPAAYPRADFESMWRDVCWNHHHDTLPGSFIHAAAEYSYKMYDAILDRAGAILTRSREHLIAPMLSVSDPPGIVVFNPLAWTRSEMVEAVVRAPAGKAIIAVRDETGEIPAHVHNLHLTGEDGPAIGDAFHVAFRARNTPGCGYKRFEMVTAAGEAPRPEQTAELPPAFCEARFKILHEKPHGMTAWTIGEYDKVTDLQPVGKPLALDSHALRHEMRQTFTFNGSTITQDVIRYADSQRIDYRVLVDWQEVGTKETGSNMLKVAFDTGLKADSAVYEIPFGDITRKNNGHENVALKWVAVTGKDKSGNTKTVAVLNDCKHAYDVKDGVIRLTLLRSSYDPDPKPDVGGHHIRYALLPMDGPIDRAALTRAAWEFNKPLDPMVFDLARARERGPEAGTDGQPRTGSAADPGTNGRKISMDVPPTQDARQAGNKPQTAESWSGLSAEPANIIVTILKRAEDNDDFILRAYECAGKPANATFTLGFPAKAATENDLLERDMKDGRPVTLKGNTLTADFKPHEIRTFRLSW